MSNRLKNEKSPYLLQHKEHPVNWYPWCKEAFEKAKKEDKPIFLSIGYSTCHWCHVMAHESFEDEAVAGILNQGYVCIKVDREEMPDVDAVYMAVCQVLTGSGGWPLTIIMTPEQKPFFAGTYFPKERYYGRPGLVDILKEVLVLWRDRREDLIRDGEEITAVINRKTKDIKDAGNMKKETKDVKGLKDSEIREAVQDRKISMLDRLPTEQNMQELELLREAYHQFEKQFDPVWGGFGSAPKFPSPHNLLFLMRYGKEEKKPEALHMAEATLDAMAAGGMHDHIGGGFSRYSTDECWLVPHFEKMLYDNALLMQAYLEAYRITGKEAYENTLRHTADYILRELTDEQGGFYCGQDADSDGVEGKYYVFTPEEVKSVLGEADGNEFCRQYGITEEGNFEGKSIPNRIGQREEQTGSAGGNDYGAGENGQVGRSNVDEAGNEVGNESECEIGKGKKSGSKYKLYEYRLGRTSLHKDDKILLSWNAWTIIAFARAGVRLHEPRYLDAARCARAFIEKEMVREDGRLCLRFRDGEAAHQGQLEDYAVYALAQVELYRATFQVEYLSGAVLRAGQMMRYFEDEDAGGYYMNASDAVQLIARPKEMYDGAIPSGNSAAAMVLQRLATLTGEVRWQDAARRQIAYCTHEISGYPAGYSYALLAMAEAVYPHRELVCTVSGEMTEKLWDELNELSMYGMDILVKTKENAEELAECAPFTGEYRIPEEGEMYYLCENGTCRTPVRSLEELQRKFLYEEYIKKNY